MLPTNVDSSVVNSGCGRIRLSASATQFAVFFGAELGKQFIPFPYPSSSPQFLPSSIRLLQHGVLGLVEPLEPAHLFGNGMNRSSGQHCGWKSLPWAVKISVAMLTLASNLTYTSLLCQDLSGNADPGKQLNLHFLGLSRSQWQC